MALQAEAVSRQQIGAPVPDFQLATITGEQVSLQMTLNRKKAALVVFWSSVCSHCARYDDYLNSFRGSIPMLE